MIGVTSFFSRKLRGQFLHMVSEILAIAIFFAFISILAESLRRRSSSTSISHPDGSMIKHHKGHLKIRLGRNSHCLRERKLDDLDLLLMHDRDQFVF